MQLTAFIYVDHIQPEGLMPKEKAIEASAAWHFTKLAMQILDKIPEQVAYEGETDRTVRLRTVAESVAKLYDVTLQEMMDLMPAVRREANRCGLEWNDRYQAWLDSGGKSFDEVTREEGRLNIQ